MSSFITFQAVIQLDMISDKFQFFHFPYAHIIDTLLMIVQLLAFVVVSKAGMLYIYQPASLTLTRICPSAILSKIINYNLEPSNQYNQAFGKQQITKHSLSLEIQCPRSIQKQTPVQFQVWHTYIRLLIMNCLERRFQEYFQKYNMETKLEKRKEVRLLSVLFDLEVRKVPSGLKSESSIKSRSLLSDQILRKQTKETSIKNFALISEEIDEKFIPDFREKALLDQGIIFESLKKHFLFSALLEDQRIVERLIDKFQSCQVKRGWYLICQNDTANYFFILQSGILAVEVDGKEKGRLYPGDGFGELALLYSSPRSASIKAVKDSTLWYIDRDTFKYFSNNIMRIKFQENLNFINSSQFFSPLSLKQKSKLASTVISLKYEDETKIFQSGSRASSMFIVKSGKLKKSIGGYSVQMLKKGDVFEEFAVLTRNALHRETLITVGRSELLSFDSETIQKVLGKTLPLIVCRNMIRERLLNLSYFNCLSPEYVQKIIDTFQIRKVEPSEVVTWSGLAMKNFIFFIIEGNFRISNSNKVSEVYGCEALEKQLREITYDFSLDFMTSGKIAYSSVQAIQSKLACSFRQLQQINNKQMIETQILKKTILSERETLKFCHSNFFQILDEIGSGHFGTVYKARCIKNNKIYAFKVIQKRPERKKYIDHEKQIMSGLIHPFIMNYYAFYENSKSAYFVLQLIEGKELFEAIRSLGLLSFSESQFYLAILFEVIYSMHRNNIVYRDLKPENIMLQKNGYLKVIDLGTAKILTGNQRTFTIIGTPSYMAPQIILGKGYSYEVDLWSLGVLLFEFLGGYLPFGEDLEDPYQIFQEVLYKDLEIASHMQHEDSNSLIQRLLSRTPHERLLGCYSTIRNHPFFDGINWQQLLSKRIKPPYFSPQKIQQKFFDIQEAQEQKALKKASSSNLIANSSGIFIRLSQNLDIEL